MNIYTQQLGFRQGVNRNERRSLLQVNEDANKIDNAAENSIAKCKNPFLFLWTLLGAFLCFFPELAWADNQAMSFSPPPSDLSIVFLRDIFGLVDGVLAGGGSQILGSMFGIFNAAVLSLAGIVIIYTILVATVNTAGDGQVLGKNWSSIWIPIRTTIGISLLFTYSSGYSVLQIFFMWIVVQGVGAADLIWDAALGYLQKGGVLVQPIMNSETSLMAGTSSSNNSNSIITGATTVLGGATCLFALQEQLQTLQQSYLAAAQNGNPPCANLSVPTSSSSQAYTDMYNFCNNPVPNLVGAVDIVGAQASAMEEWNAGNCMYQTAGSTQANPTTSATTSDGQAVQVSPNCYGNTISVYMPNFPASNIYSALNGICGTLTFGTIQPEFSAMLAAGDDLSTSDMAALSGNVATARAVAVQQVFSDLSLVAQSMTNNDQSLNENVTDSTSLCGNGGTGVCYFTSPSYSAMSPFGVPASTSATNPLSCLGYWTGSGAATSSPTCTQWASPSPVFAPLMNGTELQNSVSDYNSVMEPSLNLMANYSTIQQSTQFVDYAEQQGWIMAGSYFFNLAQVNANDSNTTITDNYSYLGTSVPPPTIGSTNFCSNTSGALNSSTTALCTWYSGNGYNSNGTSTYGAQMSALFGGPTPDNANAIESFPNYAAGFGPSWPAIASSELNTTVYGYAANAANIIMPNQPGTTAPAFTFVWTIPTIPWNPPAYCTSGGAYSLVKGMCYAFLAWILVVIYAIIYAIMTVFVFVVGLLISLPFMKFGAMFTQAAAMFDNVVVSPVVVIAQIGNLFINTSVDLMLLMGMISGMFGLTGVGAGALAMVFAWIGPMIIGLTGIVFSMGVEAAYYIPMVPYIIFTFASFGWMVGVLEAMVAAPIVALGVCLPEGGHDVFGKGLDSLMLILGVFLRPPMMIIAYIAAYIMSTVGIWLINTGFSYYENGNPSGGPAAGMIGYFQATQPITWTIIFSQVFFFGIYLTLCAGIITRSFELIYKLPDAIMKWIGGQNVTGMSDTVGDITSQAQGKVKEIGQAIGGAIDKGASSVGEQTKASKDKKDSAKASAAADEKSDQQHEELMNKK